MPAKSSYKNLYRQPGSDIWWLRLSVDGKKFRESTRTSNARDAVAFRDRRKAEILTGRHHVDVRQTTVGEIVGDCLADMQRNQFKTLGKARERWALHLKPTFEFQPAARLTTDHVNAYITHRQSQGAANATINRELAILKRAYSIALTESDPPKVNRLPKIPRLSEDNVRRGFVQPSQHVKLVEQAAVEGQWMLGIYLTGCTFGFRSEEVLGLRVEQVDTTHRCIYLEQTKTGEGRVAYMTDELHDALRPLIKGKTASEPVFTRPDGSRVVDFRKAWWRMCVNAGLGEIRCRKCDVPLDSAAYCTECQTSNIGYRGLLFHDLRRTAVRNMRRRGISERVAMLISGHKTRSVFDRYNIVDESDLREAGRLMQEGERKDLKELLDEKGMKGA